MTEDPNRAVVLINVPTETAAAMIMAHLEEQGIEAQVTGGLTSGFRAGMPGEVHVLVRAADLERARDLLEEIRSSPPPDDPELR